MWGPSWEKLDHWVHSMEQNYWTLFSFISQPLSEQFCHTWIQDVLPCHRSKKNRANKSWMETLKIVSQNRLYLFIRWLSQAFIHYSNGKLTKCIKCLQFLQESLRRVASVIIYIDTLPCQNQYPFFSCVLSQHWIF
jgi:hypothetical protein